ncbi:MAG: sugar-binding domain-containing protein, partial [Planctomycetota bacterium]
MRQCTQIDRSWRFFAELTPTDYQVAWTRNELRLFGDIEEIGGIDGIMWSKAGRSLGPASAEFDDSSWQAVDLPHDWSITREPRPSAAERNGFSPLAVLWYRRRFALPDRAEAGRAVLRFDGAYRQATVFVNGHLVHLHQSGYL